MLNELFWDRRRHTLGPFGENEILFTAEWHVLTAILARDHYHYSALESQAKLACDSQLNNGATGFVSRDGSETWSHDNHTGLLCLSALYDLPYHKKFFWSGFWRRIHPRDLSFYFLLRGGPFLILGYLLIPALSIAMILTCWQEFKTREGVKILKTDGKLLAWLRFKTINMPLTERICTYLVNKKFKSWAGVFATYFTETNHPNNELARLMYER